MDERGLKSAMRLLALEHAVALIMAASCAQEKDPLASVEHLRAAFRAGAAKTTFPGIDAAASDLAASEFEEALDRLVSLTKGLVTARLQRDE